MTKTFIQLFHWYSANWWIIWNMTSSTCRGKNTGLIFLYLSPTRKRNFHISSIVLFSWNSDNLGRLPTLSFHFCKRNSFLSVYNSDILCLFFFRKRGGKWKNFSFLLRPTSSLHLFRTCEMSQVRHLRCRTAVQVFVVKLQSCQCANNCNATVTLVITA